jgi:hypothetical protein
MKNNPGACNAAGEPDFKASISLMPGATDMPLVTIKLIEGVYSPGQKPAMIQEMTDTMIKLEGEHMRPVTWVVIE